MEAIIMSWIDTRGLTSGETLGKWASTDDTELSTDVDSVGMMGELEVEADWGTVDMGVGGLGVLLARRCSRNPREALRTSSIVHSATILGMS